MDRRGAAWVVRLRCGSGYFRLVARLLSQRSSSGFEVTSHRRTDTVRNEADVNRRRAKDQTFVRTTRRRVTDSVGVP
jgi:hypothetical protein